MSSTRSISFRKRNEVDEIYTFPVEFQHPTFQTRNSVVMVEHLENGKVLIIAGKLPGMTGYYKNYPDVVERDREKLEEHELARELLEAAEDFLGEFDPQTSSSTSNQGNSSMDDIYVTVDVENRDEVILKMWKLLHYLRDRHIEFLQESDEQEYHEYSPLEDEILEMTSKSDIGNDDWLSE